MTNSELAEYNKKRVINQICYVTNDYKTMIKRWYEDFQVGPWTIFAHSDEVTKDVVLDGKPVTEPFKFYCAFAWIGAIQIEVIQPVYGPSAYQKFLDEKGLGIHHIKEYVPDERLPETLKSYEEKGLNVYFKGRFMEDLFFYLDSEKSIGSVYEIGNSPDLELDPKTISFFPSE